MNEDIAITTIDNPYDPFNDWISWYLYDESMGYKTCERLASTAYTSPALSDKQNKDAIEDSINLMIKLGAINKFGNLVEYKKVYRKKN